MTAQMQKRVDDMTQAFMEKDPKSVEEPIIDMTPVEADYLTLKKNVKELTEMMEKLKAEQAREIEVAKMNGMTPEAAATIAAQAVNIDACQKQIDRNLGLMEDTRGVIRAKAEKRVKDGISSIKAGFKKFGDRLGDGLAACVATTKAINTRIKEANRTIINNVSVSASTVFANLSENVARIGRNFCAYEYQNNKDLEKICNSIANGLEKLDGYNRNVRQAIKNVGRALIGRKPAEAAQGKETLLGKLAKGWREEANEWGKEADKYKGIFDRSREKSLARYANLEKKAEEKNVTPAKSVAERFAAAKGASLGETAERAPERANDETYFDTPLSERFANAKQTADSRNHSTPTETIEIPDVRLDRVKDVEDNCWKLDISQKVRQVILADRQMSPLMDSSLQAHALMQAMKERAAQIEDYKSKGYSLSSPEVSGLLAEQKRDFAVQFRLNNRLDSALATHDFSNLTEDARNIINGISDGIGSKQPPRNPEKDVPVI